MKPKNIRQSEGHVTILYWETSPGSLFLAVCRKSFFQSQTSKLTMLTCEVIGIRDKVNVVCGGGGDAVLERKFFLKTISTDLVNTLISNEIENREEKRELRISFHIVWLLI